MLAAANAEDDLVSSMSPSVPGSHSSASSSRCWHRPLPPPRGARAVTRGGRHRVDRLGHVRLAFGVVIAVTFGGAAFGEYISGYLIEKSLSVDNVFVWAMLFTTLAIPLKYQHRVLFWGIFGALALRARLHPRRLAR